MKTAAKVFIWIGIIFQFFLIYPIIIGVFALQKLDQAKTKEELQSFGILTLLLCSLLGGIFMLCIKDEELAENNFTVDENGNVTPVKKENNAIKYVSLIGVIGLYLILLLCLIFSISATIEYNGVPYIPLIFNSILIGLLVLINILMVNKKSIAHKINLFLLIAFTILSIILIIMSIVTNFELAYFYKRGTYLDYNGDLLTYKYPVYGEGWEYWLIFILSFAVTSIGILLMILNIVTFPRENKARAINNANNISAINVQNTSKASGVNTNSNIGNIEAELNEAKKLFDSNLITEEEYNKIRSSIISKYYK